MSKRRGSSLTTKDDELRPTESEDGVQITTDVGQMTTEIKFTLLNVKDGTNQVTSLTFPYHRVTSVTFEDYFSKLQDHEVEEYGPSISSLLKDIFEAKDDPYARVFCKQTKSLSTLNG